MRSSAESTQCRIFDASHAFPRVGSSLSMPEGMVGARLEFLTTILSFLFHFALCAAGRGRPTRSLHASRFRSHSTMTRGTPCARRHRAVMIGSQWEIDEAVRTHDVERRRSERRRIDGDGAHRSCRLQQAAADFATDERSGRIACRARDSAGPEKEKAPQVRELAGLCHRFWRRRRDSNPRSRFWPRCSLSRGVPSTSRPRLPNFRSHQGGSATRTK